VKKANIFIAVLMLIAFSINAQNDSDAFEVTEDGSVYLLRSSSPAGSHAGPSGAASGLAAAPNPGVSTIAAFFLKSAKASEESAKAATKIGISESDLDALVKKYLENTLSRHLNRKDQGISEISYVPDWETSTDDFTYFNVQTKFKNFSINRRTLSGRLETNIVVRKNSGIRRRPAIENRDNRDIAIALFVDDQLSDELRDTLVRDYIRKNYDNPLDINIHKERLEVYPDRIYSYVSSVINNDSIVYLRAVFEKQPTRTEKVNIFTINETPWQLNRAEVRFSEKFPDKRSKAFKKSMEEDMFEPMRGYHYTIRPGEGNPSKSLSKIESITKSDLIEANNGIIKLEADLIYLMDWHGFIRSYRKYDVILNVFYQFNFDERKWEYKGIGEIKPENIRTIR